jgi:hypothetical protein
MSFSVPAEAYASGDIVRKTMRMDTAYRDLLVCGIESYQVYSEERRIELGEL